MNSSFANRRARGLWTGVLTAILFAAIGVPTAFAQLSDDTSPLAEDAATSGAATDAVARARRDVRAMIGDSLFGASGALRARFVTTGAVSSLPVLRSLFEDSLITRPAVLPVKEPNGQPGFHFITMRPFADKVAGRIGAYRIGNWSAERRAPRSLAYALPEGFIEVTAENQHTQVSEHFRLRDFLTKDQSNVWPKYLVLRESLIDKLELLIDELEAEGLVGYEMVIMSGFRTPQYNAQGVGAGGRASESRHQFGDAADVYLRRTTPGAKDWMPDLTGDGRSDTKDALRLARAAERVEVAHPRLVGGIGVYPATAAHGPFVHVDVRGDAARWGQW